MSTFRVTAHSAESRTWSIAAFVLSGLGVAAATWIIVGSDGDPSQVRWPLILAPAAICLWPLVVPRYGARIGAAVALGGWCVLAALSIGFLQWPALAALVFALMRAER